MGRKKSEIDYSMKVNDEEILVEIDKLSKDLIDELLRTRKEKGVTQVGIAELTGIKAPNVARIESNKHTISLNVLARYAAALGKEVKIELVDKK